MQRRTVRLPHGSMREKTAGHSSSNSRGVLTARLYGQAHTLRNPHVWVNSLAEYVCTDDLVTTPSCLQVLHELVVNV